VEPAEYTRLYDYETWYWWYRAQRAVLLDAVQALGLAPGAKLVDVGCGTGRALEMIADAVSVRAFGVDNSPLAAALWNGRADTHRCLGSANEIPFAGESFDAAVSVDVIYCGEVEPQSAVAEMARVLKPGGRLVIIVPAYEWLRSSHDLAVHGVRRFTRRGLTRLLNGAGLSVERMTHFSTALLPIIVAVRLLRRARASNGRPPSGPYDLRPRPGWLNRSLLAVAMAERRVVRHVNLPFGSSILGIARKQG
jgi:SAM-dependent methyltransferase